MWGRGPDLAVSTGECTGEARLSGAAGRRERGRHRLTWARVALWTGAARACARTNAGRVGPDGVDRVIQILDRRESARAVRFWALAAMLLALVGVLVAGVLGDQAPSALVWMLALLPVIGGVQAFLAWTAMSQTVVEVVFPEGGLVVFVRVGGAMEMRAEDLVEAEWVHSERADRGRSRRTYWRIRATTGSVRMTDNNGAAHVVSTLRQLNPAMRSRSAWSRRGVAELLPRGAGLRTRSDGAAPRQAQGER